MYPDSAGTAGTAGTGPPTGTADTALYPDPDTAGISRMATCTAGEVGTSTDLYEKSLDIQVHLGHGMGPREHGNTSSALPRRDQGFPVRTAADYWNHLATNLTAEDRLHFASWLQSQQHSRVQSASNYHTAIELGGCEDLMDNCVLRRVCLDTGATHHITDTCLDISASPKTGCSNVWMRLVAKHFP
eukprot:SAG31_NODE_477_length_15150_cov_13.611772_7_plen_187_part_00